MPSEPRANLLAGEWCEARRGARFPAASGAPADLWPQSGSDDVAQAWRAARAARRDWAATDARRRAELVLRLARELENDASLRTSLAGRLGLEADELAPHLVGLELELRALLERPAALASAVVWCAPDGRELLRAPLVDLARELLAGSVAVLVSDARAPELLQAVARAGSQAGLPAGVLGLLHGARRELVAQGLELCSADEPCRLSASGLASEMRALRRLELRSGAGARLRALRCGVLEIDPARALEASAAEVLERAFGRGATLTGQLPGALGRVWCPARHFSRFTELFLSGLEASAAARAPVPQFDDEALARVRLAVELGLDEGATCIAGGKPGDTGRLLVPTVFTNVEAYMSTARRQDPMPVLCLLRGG